MKDTSWRRGRDDDGALGDDIGDDGDGPARDGRAGRRGRRPGGREPAGAEAVGSPLALPLPSPHARATSAPDGSLIFTDLLGASELTEFLAEVAGLMRSGALLPQPAWIALGDGEGGELRVERGPRGVGGMADALSRVTEAIRAGRSAAPARFALGLDCGCGLEVRRRAPADDLCPAAPPQAPAPGASAPGSAPRPAGAP
jgi:hypothetical protein